MKVAVTLNKDDSKAYVTVVLTVEPSETKKMKSHLGEASKRFILPDGSEYPYKAAQAASFSGAFYGLRLMGQEGYAVVIKEAYGLLDKADLTICAVAARIGVAYAADRTDVMDREIPTGWHLTKCQLTEISSS